MKWGPVAWAAALAAGLTACALGPPPVEPSGFEPSGVAVRQVEEADHPAGPVVRTEWVKPGAALPGKAEISRARAGTRLVGDYVLAYQASSWMIQRENCRCSAALVLPADGSVPPWLAFESAGMRWRVRLLRQFLPQIQAGITGEDEPRADVLLEPLGRAELGGGSPLKCFRSSARAVPRQSGCA